MKNVQTFHTIFTFQFNIVTEIQITRFSVKLELTLSVLLAHNRDSVESDPVIENVVTEVRPMREWDCLFGDGMCLLKEVYRK